jgi:hypothetical protein
VKRISTLVLCAASACGGERLTEGLNEPLRVAGAQFVEGELPGSPPLSTDQVKAGKKRKQPYSTTPDIAGRLLEPRSSDLALSGRTSTDGYAVALKLRDLGTGYWLLPIGAPDPINNNELSWNARIDFLGLEPGLRYLRIAALDEHGESGTQTSLELCVRSAVPDNLNACDSSIDPPRLVVSLAWETASDLDLAVVTPTGTVIDYAHVNNAKESDVPAQFTGDSGSGCIPSGSRRENVFWQDKPQRGTYLVYANLQDACNAAATPFVVSIHESKRSGDDFDQVETYRAASELLAVQANGGSALGLFVTEFTVK